MKEVLCIFNISVIILHVVCRIGNKEFMKGVIISKQSLKLVIIIKSLVFFLFVFLIGKCIAQREDGRLNSRIDGIFVEACTQMIRGDLSNAKQMFEEVIQYDPEHHASLYYIGRIALEQREYDKAIEYCKMAIKLDDNNYWYYSTLKDSYIFKGSDQEGLKVLENITTRFPRKFDAQLELVDLYLQLKDFDKALTTLNLLAKDVGYSKEWGKRKYSVLLNGQQFDEALSLSEELLNKFPDDVSLYEKHYELLQQMELSNRANDFLTEWIELMPENPYANQALLMRTHANPDGDSSQSSIIIAINDPNIPLLEKINQLQELIESNEIPTNELSTLQKNLSLLAESYPEETAILNIQGEVLALKGVPDSARTIYLQAIDIDPSQLDIWANLLSLSFDKEQFIQLQEDAEYALEFFPNNEDFLFHYGMSSARLGEFDPAIYALTKMQKLSSTNNQITLRANAELAQVYALTDESQKAEQLFETTLAASDFDPFIMERYAQFLTLNQRDLKKALSIIEKVTSEFPNTASYLHTHGWILYQWKNYEKAEKKLSEAISISKNPIYLEHYGDVLLRLGQKEKAIDQWEDAISISKGRINIDIEEKLKTN